MFPRGTKATVIKKCRDQSSDYIVTIDDQNSTKVIWYENYMELEEVFNSPLYQAMSEQAPQEKENEDD